MNENYKGEFKTLTELRLVYPVGKQGWYASVLEKIYVWNLSDRTWISRSNDSETLDGELPSYYLDEMNHTRDFNTISSNGAINSTYRITKVDCTTGNITITLPTAVGFTGILDIMKIDSSSNTVIITPNGIETISGESTQTIYGQYDNMTIISDNSNWLII